MRSWLRPVRKPDSILRSVNSLPSRCLQIECKLINYFFIFLNICRLCIWILILTIFLIIVLKEKISWNLQVFQLPNAWVMLPELSRILKIEILDCDFLRLPCEQGLFRKIAGALPGMESVNQTKPDDYVDINLKSTTNNAQPDSQSSGGCACWQLWGYCSELGHGPRIFEAWNLYLHLYSSRLWALGTDQWRS